jgi:hypothetical protein
LLRQDRATRNRRAATATTNAQARFQTCSLVSAMSLPRLAKLAIGLEVLLGLGAVGGGVALMAGPRGEIIPLPVSALAGSPFTTYFVPGAILASILGIGPLCAAALVSRRHRSAPLLTIVVGCALIIWIAVEIAMIGYSSSPPLQLGYLVLGGAIVLVGAAWSWIAEQP